MLIEQQVCSVEFAIILKELGVEQESHFIWHSTNNSWELTSEQTAWMDEKTSAFTVAELGALLPADRYEIIKDDAHRFSLWVFGTGFSGNTEADARAKALIYFLQSKQKTV